MRVSISSMFLWDLTPWEMADVLRLAGIEEMELWAETPWYWESKSPERLQAMKEALAPLRLTMHAPVMDMNPSSYNDRVHRATIEESLDAIEMARFLGADILTIHPGKRTAKREVREEDRRKFREYLDACLGRAAGITLSLENLPPEPWNICSSPEEMSYYLEAYDLGLTLDISHATPPLERALAFVDLLGGYLTNVHASATVEGVQHMPPSLGTIDPVIRAIEETGYSGPYTLELDDKKFPGGLSREGKAGVLRRERRYLQHVAGENE